MMSPNDNNNINPILVLILVLWIIMVIFSVFAHFIYSEEIDMNTDTMLMKELKKQEGYRAVPYKDTQGFWTIGYGHNLLGRSFDHHENAVLFPSTKTIQVPITPVQYVQYWEKNPLTTEQAEYILEQDILIVKHTALKIYKGLWEKFDKNRQVAILDLLFNLGEYRYKKFKRHIKATKALDWEKSAAEILNSKAARQDPNRYEEIAKQLKGE